MTFFYQIKEGFAGFSRARLATLTSIVTTTIALILVGIFFLLSFNLRGLVRNLREKVELEVFLSRALTEEEIQALKAQVEQIPGVAAVHYISQDAAAKKFNEEFGENLFDVLGHNPLPASFRVRLQPEFRNFQSIRTLSGQVSGLSGVDEVLYHKDLLQILDRYVQYGMFIGIFVGSIFTLAAILLVANTVRLTIYAKREVIRTMQLIGATNWFIRQPFLLEGILQGFFAGSIAAGILFVSTQLLERYVTHLVSVPPYYIYVVIIAGICLGFLGSLVSIGRFLNRK